MTRTHVEYVERLHAGIGWARAAVAARWHGVVGLVADWISEGAREAVRARMPSHAAPDALKQLGTESGLRRYLLQTQVDYRAWVAQRWRLLSERGTPQAVERAALYGVRSDARVRELGWARFWLRLIHGRVPYTIFPSPMIGGHTIGGGAILGVSGVDPVTGTTHATAEQLTAWAHDLRRAATDWKPARSRYIGAAYPTDAGTALIGDGHTIGDGTSIAVANNVAYI